MHLPSHDDRKPENSESSSLLARLNCNDSSTYLSLTMLHIHMIHYYSQEVENNHYINKKNILVLSAVICLCALRMH